jgi:hypothetical protein
VNPLQGTSPVHGITREECDELMGERLAPLPLFVVEGKEAAHMSPQRMKPLDRVLCLTAALFGIGAFLFALFGVSDPRNQYPGRVLPFGIVCLIAGLSAASLVTWRGRWR